MSMNKNLLVISGEITTNPEKRVSPDGKLKVTRMGLTISDGAPRITVKSYNNLADKMAELKVGQSILIIGSLQTTSYKDNRTNATKYFTEVCCQHFCSSAKNAGVNYFLSVGRNTKDGNFFIGNGEKKAMYRTSMAINRSTGADNESADFIQVLAFDKKAEFLSKWVPKGTAFFAEGRLSVGAYTDKNGETKSSYELVANSVGFVNDKKGGAAGSQPAATPAQQQNEAPLPAAAGFGGWGDLPM